MGRHKIADVIGVVLAIVSAFLALGMKSFFAPCKKTSSGAWRTCHWAGQAVIAVSLLLLVMALLLVFMRKTDTKKGIAISMVPTALLNLLIPGPLISLCTSENMRCNMTMLPGVRIVSIVIAAVALLDVIVLMMGSRKERKQEAARVEQAISAGKEQLLSDGLQLDESAPEPENAGNAAAEVTRQAAGESGEAAVPEDTGQAACDPEDLKDAEK